MQTAVLERDVVTLPQRKRLKLNSKRLTLAGAALLVGLGAGRYGYDWWKTGRFIETTDDAYIGGNVTALAPHLSGFVEQILVGDNQLVHAGQVLIRLDPRDFQAALNHAQAVLVAKQAMLESLRAQLVLQQATIRQQEDELTARLAQAAFAEQDAGRYRALAQTNAGSRQDAQRTTSLEQAAKAAVASAAAGLEAAHQQLKVLDAEIAAAQAGEAQAESDLQIARLNLGYTEIRSPIDGYVGNRSAEIGAYVTQGAYLVSVIPAAGLWIDANFKENQIAQMTPGESATVVADVIPGHAFHGHVASLAPGTGAVFSVIPAENATGNFTKIVQRVPVRIMLDPGDAELRLLRPGLSTTVSVDTRQENAVR